MVAGSERSRHGSGKSAALGAAKRGRRAAAKRRQGRPSASDDGIGRQKLVDAARELLRHLPPAKITSDKVALMAGGDRALVRYYFGSMTNLLAEVARQLSRDLILSLGKASTAPGTASTRLRRRIREFVTYEVANPALHPLYADLILSGRAPAAAETIRNSAIQGHASFREIIESGWRTNEFRDDFDLRLLDIAIVGLCEFIVAGRPILESWLAPDEKVDDLLLLYRDFVADLVIRGISKKHRADRGS